MAQTEARKILKDSPVMWRRINSIGIILDCNSTYAAGLDYTKSEILGKSIFEHVPKESWDIMNDSLRMWFETGQVHDREIPFQRRDGTVFPGLLHATSLYDECGNLMGSNTVIFDLTQITDEKITVLETYFRDSLAKLDKIKKEDHFMDTHSKSELDGLEKMFSMLLDTDLGAFTRF